MKKIDDNKLARYFEKNLTVYQVSPHNKGLITGYYSPLLYGSRRKHGNYNVPLIDVPQDLVLFNTKDFGYQNSTILKGKIKDGWLVPYDSRAEINKRQEKNEFKKSISLWVTDRVDRFFMQIQGSGFVKLDTGETIYVRISGRNGHNYYAIGGYMKEKNLVEEVTMQSIRKWLAENPERMDEVLHKNPDFIFFREGGDGPIGSQGVVLTAERSIAVDRSIIPLGIPIWLETTLSSENRPWNHAVTAQDTGSAIKGNVRADIYFGKTNAAAEKAGKQNAPGKIFVFVPKKPNPTADTKTNQAKATTKE